MLTLSVVLQLLFVSLLGIANLVQTLLICQGFALSLEYSLEILEKGRIQLITEDISKERRCTKDNGN